MTDNPPTSRTIKVAAVVEDSRIAILNAGTSAGVKKGQKYLIYKNGDVVFDPDTKQSLGRVELVRGYGIVVNVDMQKSYLQAVRHKEPIGHPFGSIFARLQHKNDLSAILSLPGLKDENKDPYSIDHRKYDETKFQGIQNGDMVRLISDYS